MTVIIMKLKVIDSIQMQGRPRIRQIYGKSDRVHRPR